MPLLANFHTQRTGHWTHVTVANEDLYPFLITSRRTSCAHRAMTVRPNLSAWHDKTDNNRAVEDNYRVRYT